MTTEHMVIEAELHRAVLDEEHMAEKRAEQLDLPARELSPELWTVFWGWDRRGRKEEDGKDFQVAALVGLVLAQAHVCGHGGASVSWTLTGTPPEGRTLSDARPRGHVARAVAGHVAMTMRYLGPATSSSTR